MESKQAKTIDEDGNHIETVKIKRLRWPKSTSPNKEPRGPPSRT